MKVSEIRMSLFKFEKGDHAKHVAVTITDHAACAELVTWLADHDVDLNKADDAAHVLLEPESEKDGKKKAA